MELEEVIIFFKSLIVKKVIKEIKADKELKHDRTGEDHPRCIKQQMYSVKVGQVGASMRQPENQ